MAVTKMAHEFYGYKMIQNPSNAKLSLFVGAIDAKILRDVVSVDNAVKWDDTSNIWREGGRNRTIEEAHVKSIEQFLSSQNLERILPSAIVISVEGDAFKFKPFSQMPEISMVTPGILEITGKYLTDDDGNTTPVEEKERTAWVLDGQHRTKAFRQWSMPDPYPVNVIIIKAWQGIDYEDAMRHQTYELNMGRPLSEDFKASIRERYKTQVGHLDYKKQIALSWIRKDIEGRGAVFSPNAIVGAPKLRTPYIVTMSFVEKLISLAFDSDDYLKTNYNLQDLPLIKVGEVGKYLFDFYEGVRLSIGVLNPTTKGTIGSDPVVQESLDYWDIATKSEHKQRLLHNVGLKAITKGLLHSVMRSSSFPKSPQDVAKSLEHMKGIPWHDTVLQTKKDDWAGPLADALKKMYDSKGTLNAKSYTMTVNKKDRLGNPIDPWTIKCHGWKSD